MNSPNQSQYLKDLIEGFANKDPRYISLDHSGQEPLSQIPFTTLRPLSSIRCLSVKNNSIKKIPSEIGKLTAIEVLDISDNPIEYIASEIGNCKALKFFRASDLITINFDTYFDSLMAGPGHHPEFTSNAGLTSLPESFANLQQLHTLQMDGNRFKIIPPCLFELKQLVSLDISANLLDYIAPEIGQLKNLRYLKLSRNNFRELPATLGQLKQLERLRLDALDLKTLPESIADLSNLKMLEICQGRIEAFPDSMKNLKSLKHLYLVDTEVSDIDLNMIKILMPETQIHFEPGF